MRVVVEHDDGGTPARREDLWLLIEWPDDERDPTHYTLSSLPRTTSAKQLVRLVKERYRTERVYEDLKAELGFDHYEGPCFPGWHHHISLVLCCFAFIVAERGRLMLPRFRGQSDYAAIAATRDFNSNAIGRVRMAPVGS
jgi:SRSO17 transposase